MNENDLVEQPVDSEKLWVWSTHLYNIDLDGGGPLSIGPFEIVRNPPIEEFRKVQERLETVYDGQGAADIVMGWHTRRDLWSPYSVELREYDPSSSISAIGEQFDELVTILRLWKPGGVGRSGWFGRMRRGDASQVTSSPKPTLRGGRWTLPLEEAPEFRRFFDELFPMNSSQFSLATARFDSYFSRPDDLDAFIDLLVALEAAFGDRSPGETGYKIALRAALFLEDDVQERERTFKLLKAAYDKRSGVLHGRAVDADWVRDNVAEVEQRVRRALVAFARLEKGGELVPQAEQWNGHLFWDPDRWES